jgi:hypothetical protein
MDSILLAVALGLLSLAFVLQPLYSARTGRRGKLTQEENDTMASSVSPTSAASDSIQSGQTEREQAARAALHEVELDYQLGNITEADYRALRERYTRRALRELKARYDREQELDELIERQLQRLKEEDEQNT